MSRSVCLGRGTDNHVLRVIETLLHEEGDQVVVRCADGQVSCSRTILSVLSPLIRNSCINTQELVLCIPDVQTSDIKDLFENIASGKISCENQDILKLLSVNPPAAVSEHKDLGLLISDKNLLENYLKGKRSTELAWADATIYRKEVEKNDEHMEEIEKKDDHRKEVEKNDDLRKEVEKKDEHMGDVEKSDEHMEDVEKKDEQREDVSKISLATFTKVNEEDTDSFNNCFQDDPDLIVKVEKFIAKTDSGDNSYVCKMASCSYSSKKKVLLKYHVLVHLKQKPIREVKEDVLSYIDFIKSKSRRKSVKAEIDDLDLTAIDNSDELEITHTEDDPTHPDDDVHQPEDLKEDSENKVVIDVQDLQKSQVKTEAINPKISSKVKKKNTRKKKSKTEDISVEIKKKCNEYIVYNNELKEYTCNHTKCGYMNRSKMILYNHMVKHLGIKLFSCDECSQEFATSKLLKKHISSEHGSDEMRRAYENWILEMKDVSGESWLKCNFPECNFTAASKKGAGLHALSSHTEKSFICHQCGDSFLTESSLAHHSKYKHKKESGPIFMLYQCKYCNKHFKTLSYLTAHENEHKGVRPFQCDACGKSFASAGMLRSHKFSHAPKIFKCDCCDQAFPRRNTLLVHLRAVHMHEKPYECDICGQRFPRSSSMTRHRRIHTGLPNYQCQYCHKTTTQRGDLNRHVAKMHPWSTGNNQQQQQPTPTTIQHPLPSNIQQQLQPSAQQQQQEIEGVVPPVEEHTYVITHVENVYFQRK